MREELHRVLDGEDEADALPADLRREVEAWRSLFREMRAGRASGAPAGTADRVLRAVAGERPRSAWRRFLEWWLEPRTVRLSPIAGLATAAAVLIAALALPSPWSDGEAPASGEPVVATSEGAGSGEAAMGGPGAPSAAPVYVQFLFRAPGARSVALAGDFNEWRPDVALQDPDGDGVWAARVPLRPGVHEYMFVVDGEEWVTDPQAERYAEDGFGNRNAVVAIARPSRGL